MKLETKSNLRLHIPFILTHIASHPSQVHTCKSRFAKNYVKASVLQSSGFGAFSLPSLDVTAVTVVLLPHPLAPLARILWALPRVRAGETGWAAGARWAKAPLPTRPRLDSWTARRGSPLLRPDHAAFGTAFSRLLRLPALQSLPSVSFCGSPGV